MKVLILDDGRQCLPFLRSLKLAGHTTELACGSHLSPGAWSNYCDKRLFWPNYFQDEQGFTNTLLKYVKVTRPDVTLSVGDIGVRILAHNKNIVTKFTRVTVPDLEIFEKAADKVKTMSFCMANNIPCPKTYPLDDEKIGTATKDLTFPVMVKPRKGIGAVGLHRFDTAEKLKKNYKSLKEKYGNLLIQEYIPLEGGTQYQAEAFLDENSQMKVCMVIAKPRFFPVTGGTSTANLTIDHPDIQKSVRLLLEGINWKGAADVDLILDLRNNIPKILEINPRVTAGIKIGFAAGIDYSDLHMRLATGKPIPQINSYKLGVYSRNLCMDILWYIFSSRKARKTASPSFFKFFGKDVCFQTFGADDYMPFIGFILGMLKKYFNPSVWKSKLGKDLKE